MASIQPASCSTHLVLSDCLSQAKADAAFYLMHVSPLADCYLLHLAPFLVEVIAVFHNCSQLIALQCSPRSAF